MKSAMITKAAKARFIRELCRSIEKTAIEAIPKMPEEWDGHELREMLAGIFNEARSNLMQEERGNQRRKNYDNERIVRNLP